MSVYGWVVCLDEKEFDVCLRGWKRPPPILAEPVKAFNPLTGGLGTTRMVTPRPLADPDAVVLPDFREFRHEVVDGLGPEALEHLGVALKVWDATDKLMRVSGLQLSGPDKTPLGIF